MNILLTGASSFTGFWFIQALIDRGHRVCAIFRKNPSEYEGVRKQRLKNMSPYVEKVFRCSFGSKAFMSLIRKRSFDLFVIMLHKFKDTKITILIVFEHWIKTQKIFYLS